MSLQPVDPILDTILSVAERDPRAAQELVRFALYESLTEQVAKARPRLDADGAKWMAERVLRARETFEEAGVSKAMAEDPETAQILEGLEVIETYIQKDLIGSMLAFFNRSHPRDEQGRFVRRDVQRSPSLRTATRVNNHTNEVISHLQQWKNSKLVNDESRVALHMRDSKVNGQSGELEVSDKGEQTLHFTVGELLANNAQKLKGFIETNGDHMTPVGVSFDRRQIPQQNAKERAALDAMAMFTGGQGVEAGHRALGGLGTVTREEGDKAGNRWNRPSGPGDRQSYRRLQMTGQALQHVSGPGTPGDMIGGMARLIGDLGPEAEKVFGPSVRRTAYRYRGTERRPDKGIVSSVEEAHTYAGAISGSEEVKPEQALMIQQQLSRKQTGEIPPALGVAQHYANRTYSGWTQDRLELAMQGDTAAVQLLEAVPDQKLAAISIEAGELPPSQGVMMDADGDIVSHAQGFNGDHYLPFDLKNLADLQGGQYVRTRAAGGPTTEDLYTGLMTGARQLQVVSNSGVYTVEFDPDLRGGRRYSDKATRMIQRYGKLLEAIEGGTLYENDVDSAKRGELRRRAYEQAGWNAELGQERYETLLQRERMQATVNQEDEDAFYEEALAEVNEAEGQMQASGRTMSNQQRARELEDIVNERKAEFNANKVRQMVLDGKGYAAALKSLQQEFPFYIRDIRFETVPEFLDRRGARKPQGKEFMQHARDRGYTQRGQTNARATMKLGDPRMVQQPRKAGEAQAEAVGGGGGGGGTTARTVTSQQTQQAGAGGGSSDTPRAARANDGRVRPPIAGDTKPFDKILAPGSVVQETLKTALNRVTGIWDALVRANMFTLEDMDGSDANARGGAAPGYVHYVLHNAKNPIKDPKKLANWLLNEADEEQREKFIEGIHQGVAMAMQDDVLMRSYAASPEAMLAHVDEIDTLGQLGKPFGEMEDEPFMADPDSTKPQPYPAILELGDKPANYDAFFEMAKDDHKQLAEYIVTAQAKPDELVTMINNRRNALINERGKSTQNADKVAVYIEELDALQRARTYAAARRIAELVDVGKALAPKPGQPVAKAHQRRVLVWHTPSEEFSKAVRAQLV